MTESMKPGDARSLAIVPKTLAECTSLAEILSKSDLIPKELRGKIPNVLMTIMAGQEMGLTPMASLRSFHVIEGKPVMGADGMVALVLGSGKAVYFDRIAESATSVTYETLRVGSKTPRQCTWTIDMAKTAGVHLKDNWRSYPRAMLAARAKSELARDVYPDILAGCYTAEEIDAEYAREPRAPVDAVDAEIVSETKVEHAILATIRTAESVEQLKGMVREIAALSGSDRDDAKEAYQGRMTFLRARDAGAKSNGVVDKPQPEPAA